MCDVNSLVTARMRIAAEVGREDVSLVLERGQKVLCDNITFLGLPDPTQGCRSTAASGGKVEGDDAVPMSPDG